MGKHYGIQGTIVVLVLCCIHESLSSRSYLRVRYSSHDIKNRDQFDFARPLVYPSGFADPQYCSNMTQSANTAHGEGWSVQCLHTTQDLKPGLIQVGSRACTSMVTCQPQDRGSNNYLVQAARDWSTLTYAFLDESYGALPISCSTSWDPVYTLLELQITLTYSQTVGPYEAGTEVLGCNLRAVTGKIEHNHRYSAFRQVWNLQPQEVALSGNAWILELVLIVILIGVMIAIAFVVIGYFNEKKHPNRTTDLTGEIAYALQDADNL